MNIVGKSGDGADANSDKRSSFQWRLLRGHKAAIAWLLLGGLAVALATGMALPILILKMIDEGVIDRDPQALILFTMLALAVQLVQFSTSYLIRIRRARLRNQMVEEVSLGMLNGFYRLPFRSVLQKDSGYFISRIHDEAPRAVEPLLRMAVDLSVTILSLLISLVVAVFLSWRVALFVAVGVPLFHSLSRKVTPKIRQTSQEASEEEAIAKGVLERLVGAYRVVNIFSRHKEARQGYTLALRRQMDKLFANARFGAIFGSLGAGFVHWSATIVLSISGYEVIQGRLTLGGMIAISNIYGRMIGYAQELVNALPSLHSAQAILTRVFEFQSQAEERVPPLASVDGAALRSMGFAYGTEEICSDLNLTIQKGERVLVLGSNGSGKTTLAHIMAGLLKPSAGAAEVPGVSRTSAAFFPPIFIPGDIAANLGFDCLSDSKKEWLAQIAQAFEIQDLIGKDPQELSAGQRQKASLLRALLKDAELYIFDEPFANIDAKTKDKVFQALLEFTQGKSLMVIMHCEDHLHQEFDQVIDLDVMGSQFSRPQRAGPPRRPDGQAKERAI